MLGVDQPYEFVCGFINLKSGVFYQKKKGHKKKLSQLYDQTIKRGPKTVIHANGQVGSLT
jgi:hypothetical protein